MQTTRLDIGGATNSVGQAQMPYAQKNVLEMSEIHLTGNFDDQVDYAEEFNVLNVHETHMPLTAADDQRIAARVSKGLPVLAVIFSPALQSEYEMSCEGSALWCETGYRRLIYLADLIYLF